MHFPDIGGKTRHELHPSQDKIVKFYLGMMMCCAGVSEQSPLSEYELAEKYGEVYWIAGDRMLKNKFSAGWNMRRFLSIFAV